MPSFIYRSYTVILLKLVKQFLITNGVCVKYVLHSITIQKYLYAGGYPEHHKASLIMETKLLNCDFFSFLVTKKRGTSKRRKEGKRVKIPIRNSWWAKWGSWEGLRTILGVTSPGTVTKYEQDPFWRLSPPQELPDRSTIYTTDTCMSRS